MANVTIIPEDYDGLKKEYLVLRKELDNVNQELYGCKRQLKVAEALQHEYQSEIELLQSEEGKQKQGLEEKITQLEETISNIRSKHNERIQTLEFELSEKEKETEGLQTEIEFLKRHNSVRSSTEDNSKLVEELVQLKEENEALLENEEELKQVVEIFRKNNFTLEESLTECREELSCLKESLSCKRDELFEANDVVQRLNDELCCVKTELESFKSKPLNEESKGNSLFAEVDDRRVYLQKTINTMKSEYISMKQERAKHLNLISHLRKENKTLCERWKADMEEKEDDQDMILKAYRDRIEILENLLEKYKKDLSSKPVVITTGTFSEIEFYQIMLNNKIKESEELRDQLASRGLTQTILSTSLKDANKEIRKWRLEATLRQCQLELKQDDSISEKVTKKMDEDMDDKRMELKQTKKGPHLACKKDEKEYETRAEVVEEFMDVKKKQTIPDSEVKDVITINDSNDDIEIVDVRVEIKQEDTSIVKDEMVAENLEENKENLLTVDENVVEKNFGKEEGPEEEKNAGNKPSRKVTFSQNTVSPKLTDRTALKTNCRRIVVPKPIYIPSEEK